MVPGVDVAGGKRQKGGALTTILGNGFRVGQVGAKAEKVHLAPSSLMNFPGCSWLKKPLTLKMPMNTGHRNIVLLSPGSVPDSMFLKKLFQFHSA